MSYVVVCMADGDTAKGFQWVAARRRVFSTKDAAEAYAGTVSPARYPEVVTAGEYLIRLGWQNDDDYDD